MDKDKWEITGHSMTRLSGTIKHAECVSRAVVEKNEALNARHNSSEVMRIHGRILDKEMEWSLKLYFELVSFVDRMGEINEELLSR